MFLFGFKTLFFLLFSCFFVPTFQRPLDETSKGRLRRASSLLTGDDDPYQRERVAKDGKDGRYDAAGLLVGEKIPVERGRITAVKVLLGDIKSSLGKFPAIFDSLATTNWCRIKNDILGRIDVKC